MLILKYELLRTDGDAHVNLMESRSLKESIILIKSTTWNVFMRLLTLVKTFFNQMSRFVTHSRLFEES